MIIIKVAVISIRVWALGTIPKIIEKREGTGYTLKDLISSNHITTEIAYSTKKGPGLLKNLVVTQTYVKTYQLTLVWTCKD